MKMPDFPAIIASAQATPFLGEAIVFFRELRNMTQKELAAATKLGLSAIKRLEAGRKRGGWPNSLELICNALKISPGQLFEHARMLAVADALKTTFDEFAMVPS